MITCLKMSGLPEVGVPVGNRMKREIGEGAIAVVVTGKGGEDGGIKEDNIAQIKDTEALFSSMIVFVDCGLGPVCFWPASMYLLLVYRDGLEIFYEAYSLLRGGRHTD